MANVVNRSVSAIDDRIAALERELADISEDESSDDDGGVGDRAPSGSALPSSSTNTNKRRAADDERPLMSKQRRQDAPPAITSLWCDVCGVGVNSVELMEEHLAGRKHLYATKCCCPSGRHRGPSLH